MRQRTVARGAATWVLLLALALPSVAVAQDFAATLAELKDAASAFNIKPGTFDPGAPSASQVAGAVVADRIDNDGYPENFQVTEVYSITKPDEGDFEGFWPARYRTNVRVGALKNPVFTELVAYDPANDIPLGVGGFYSIGPWRSLQVMAADLAGAGATADELASCPKIEQEAGYSRTPVIRYSSPLSSTVTVNPASDSSAATLAFAVPLSA